MSRSAFFLAALLLAGCAGSSSTPAGGDAGPVSGRLDDGLRVLQFDPAAADQRFTVYRGDYVRPELTGGGPFTLEIDSLGVARDFPATGDASPYFKVPDVGTFAFRIRGGDGGTGGGTGTIEALEYRATGYSEVNAREAAALIDNVRPFVLDVRTPREFRGGHLEGATLIPVQVLRREIPRLTAPKDEPVFVYCRTGNRSTVAAQMLIDAGFTRVVNLRYGIVEWAREGLPVVR